MKLRTTLILLLFTGGLLAYILMQERHQPTTREQQAQDKRPFPFKPEEADEVELARKDRTLRILLRNGAWRIGQPFDDAADPELVKQLLEGVSNTEWVNSIEREELRKEDLKRTGLGDDAVDVSVRRRGELLAQASFGGASALEGCIYASLPSQRNEIRIARTSLLPLLSKPDNDWRDPRLVRFNLERVRRLTMIAGTGGMEFTRSGPDQPWQLIKPLQTRASSNRVDAVLRALLKLEVKPASGPAATHAPVAGPDLPDMNVAIESSDMAKPINLTLKLNANPASDVQVLSDQRDGVFLTKARAAEFWRLQPNDLRDQNMVHIPKNQVTALRIRSQTQAEVVLDKKGDTWMLTRFGRTEPANAARVTRLIDTLNATPVHEFLSDTANNLEAWGLAQPLLSVEWRVGNAASTLDIGQSPKSIVTAHVRGEPFVYRPKTFHEGVDMFSAIPPDSLRWRGTKVVNVSVLSVRRIVVAEGDKPAMTLLHNPDATWQASIAGRDVTSQLDTAKANQLLQELAEFQAADWSSDRAGALAALEHPSLVVQLLVADRLDSSAEPKPTTLHFAPLQPGMDTALYHGRKDGDPDTFLISREAYRALTAPVVK